MRWNQVKRNLVNATTNPKRVPSQLTEQLAKVYLPHARA